jgi:hypothetical protein
MKRLALVTCFLMPAGVLIAAPHGSGFSHGGRAGASSAARTHSANRANAGTSRHSASTNAPASNSPSSTGGSSSGGTMGGGCMGSNSTGTTSTGTASIGAIGFGSSAVSGYSMYGIANTAGLGFGGSGYISNGYASGNPNSSIGQATVRGNGPSARFNPLQTQKPSAVASDSLDSPPLDLPSRSWTDEAGNVAVEGQFVGLLDGKVIVRKSSGSISLVSLDQLSETDQQYVSSFAGHRAATVATSE